MNGAGAATATAANRETKSSTLESMTRGHRESVNKMRELAERKKK